MSDPSEAQVMAALEAYWRAVTAAPKWETLSDNYRAPLLRGMRAALIAAAETGGRGRPLYRKPVDG